MLLCLVLCITICEPLTYPPQTTLVYINRLSVKGVVELIFKVSFPFVFVIFRITRSFCQDPSWGFWTMPFYRLLQEYIRSKVEPTLWFVSINISPYIYCSLMFAHLPVSSSVHQTHKEVGIGMLNSNTLAVTAGDTCCALLTFMSHCYSFLLKQDKIWEKKT